MTQIPTPSVPPFIESNEHEFHDSGVPSKVAIAKHPLHPLIVTLDSKLILPNVEDPLKAESAQIFAEFWQLAKTDAAYLVMLDRHERQSAA
jgi:hypothetical protein